MPEMIRTFIAIELNDGLRQALGKTQAQFKRERAAHAVKWVAPESIHVTLKFLGDVDKAMMPDIQNALASACADVPPFSLTLAGAGAFPNTRRPNVIWIGARGDVDIATRLVQNIEDACAGLGLAREERPFSAHLTIGRVKRDASPGDRQLIGEMIAKVTIGDLGIVRAERISIMKSELRPTGSVYSRLHAVQLQMTNEAR